MSLLQRVRLVLSLFSLASRSRRKRMFLTVASIAWGTVSIMLVLTFGEGLRRQMWVGMTSQLVPEAFIAYPRATSKAYRGLPEGRPIRLEIEEVERLRRRADRIEGLAAESIRWGTSVSYGDRTRNIRLAAVDGPYGRMRNMIPQPGGRFLDPLDQAGHRRVAFLGWEIARELFGSEPPVGRTVSVEAVPYTVIGVLRRRLDLMQYAGPDDRGVWIPLSTHHDHFGKTPVGSLLVLPGPAGKRAAVQELVSLVSGRYRFDPSDTRALFLLDFDRYREPVFRAIRIINVILTFAGAITLAVAGMGLANMMVAVVVERTPEIGVQRALGARSGSITGPLVLEGTIQTLAGGVAGTLLVAGLVALIRSLPLGADPALEFLQRPTFSPAIMAGAAALLGGIGLLAGYIPARRAARIDPVETLRCE